MIKSELKNSDLIIYLEGKISSQNAHEVDIDVTKILELNKFENIIFDLENLDYISSAGLRIILKVRQLYENMKIINVSSEVYEVFEMTGFNEMITIEKAYRKIDIKDLVLIGEGAVGKVYKYGNETIVKVYNNQDSLASIKYERKLARRAFVLGVPTAISYDVVKVGDKFGSVFELLDTYSLAQFLNEDSEHNINKAAEYYAGLLKIIHSKEVEPGEMSDYKKWVLELVDDLGGLLEPQTHDKLIKLVNNIPDSRGLIHGDYHVKNVLIQNNEALLIDMDTLSMGHPIFEFSGMIQAYYGFGLLDPTIVTNFLGVDYKVLDKFFRKTVEIYIGKSDKDSIDEFIEKASIITGIRMVAKLKSGRIDPELAKAAKDILTKLSNKYDSLI